jgi:hypothetical protein
VKHHSRCQIGAIDPQLLRFQQFPRKILEQKHMKVRSKIYFTDHIMTFSSGEVEPPFSGNTKNEADKELTVTVCYSYIKLTSKTLRPQTPAEFSENTLPLDPHWPDRGGIDSRRHDWQQCPRPPWLRSTIVWM